MKIAMFMDHVVGLKIANVLNKHSIKIDLLILNHTASEDYKEQIKSIIDYDNYFDYNIFLKHIQKFDFDNEYLFDIGILCWWPYIIKNDLIKAAKIGFLNFHPSLLPFGRGKNPNFWTFVDDTPYGVTIHWVSDTIDGGDIAYQRKINKTWLDNAESLYKKAQIEIVDLFEKNLNNILKGSISRKKQSQNLIVHHSKELDVASQIYLNQNYTALKLINLLRARTFHGYPACWFRDDNKRYEITVNIKEV